MNPHDPTQQADTQADTQAQLINRLIADAGGDPDDFDGQLVRETIAAALKLVRDDADTGELKLINRALRELRYALKVFRPYRHARKVTMFGSARTPEQHPDYRAAELFARQLADRGWMVITGAGDGIMKAGHGGAGREGSFGVAIRLPFETTANEYIAGDNKLITFRYFFTRKLLFVSQADAVVLFPGGFGTHDEGFEVLTLVQTGKNPVIPLVMVDAPGGDYWTHWDRYIRDHLLDKGMISPQDLNLYRVTDSVEDALEEVVGFYRNYHSQRFVGEKLVLRTHRPLAPDQLERLNHDFADLVADGRIEQSGPLEGEAQHLDLNRLAFTSTRRDYGRLRLLIDQINSTTP